MIEDSTWYALRAVLGATSRSSTSPEIHVWTILWVIAPSFRRPNVRSISEVYTDC